MTRWWIVKVLAVSLLLGVVGWPACGPSCRTEAAEPGAGPSAALRDRVLGKVLAIDDLDRLLEQTDPLVRWRPYRANLAPAEWVWLPSGRTLSNTFVLFRREIDLPAQPVRATGWISADSRYRLTINGRRVQWGPAPCDPRQLDVDPVDLTPHLRPGTNVLGVEVLHYGIGEGTWAAGKPGMIFHATLRQADGRTQSIVSDRSWQCLLDRAHRPGTPKRWFLRTLQEEFDARLHPAGWDTPEFRPDDRWIAAAPINCPADKPSGASAYPGNDSMDNVDPAQSSLRVRQIPPVRETIVPALRLADCGPVQWRRDPLDWFEFRMPDCFRISRKPIAAEKRPGAWELPATAGPGQAVFATLEFAEQIVGFPGFTIDAPAGTIVELVTQESHDPTGKSVV